MGKSRILVVDDERIVSLDIQGALVRLGYTVAGAATTGAAALELAGSAEPDLVLMDIHLDGGMDGAEAALRLSQSLDVPVVFLTAYSDEQTMRRALAASPFGYLIKPFEDRELRGIIELALAKHGAERDLRRARRVAEASDYAKTVFLSALGRELKAPVDGILGLAETLLLSGLGAAQRDAVETLKRYAQGVTETLTQVLGYASLETGAGGPELREFALAELLEQIAAGCRDRAEAKGLEFSVEAAGLPARAFGSPERVRQALEQLLDNALNFTEKGAVRLAAAVDGNAGPGAESVVLVLRVGDTGPGIAPELLPCIFEGFGQGGSFLGRRCKGLGLGLAMCRRVAECLGGRVSVTSVVGQGSEFVLRLPLRSAALAVSGRGPLGGARVLVAKGPGAAPLPLAQALEIAGGRVALACGGAQAADMLAAEPVEAVVFAPSLEMQAALALTRMVRAGLTQAPDTLPLLGVMPQAGPADCERCLMAGMDAVLTEFSDSLHCIDRLERLLDRRSSPQSTTTDRQGADAP